MDYDSPLKIVLVGGYYAGKSSFLAKYTEWALGNWEQAINYDFVMLIKGVTTIKVHGKLLRLQIWDNSALLRFRSLRERYIRSVHGLLIIIDLTSTDAFYDTLHWKSEIDKFCSDKKPLAMLVGNKADLEDKRVFTYEEFKKLADELGILYIETSVKVRVNLEQAFEVLATF